MRLLGVDKSVRHVAVAVKLRHRAQLIAVDPGLFQHSVDFLAHPAISTVNQVLDHRAVGECDFAQVGGGVVVILGGAAGVGSGLALAGFGVGVGDIAILEQSVLT